MVLPSEPAPQEVTPAELPGPDNPQTYEEVEEHEPEEVALRGDKGVRGFWNHGRECCFDARSTNTE